MNLDLRNSDQDQSQRMLNAIEPGSVVPIHRHPTTLETVVCLRGRLVEEYYSEDGVCTETIEMCPGGPVVALNISAGVWHAIRDGSFLRVFLRVQLGTVLFCAFAQWG